MLTLSPEAYLRYPVVLTPPQFSNISPPQVNSKQVDMKEIPLHEKGLPTQILLLDKLRRLRMRTLTADIESLTSTDPVVKYLAPVVDVCNSALLNPEETPKLRYIGRKDSGEDGVSRPIGLIVSGTRNDSPDTSAPVSWHLPSLHYYHTDEYFIRPEPDWERVSKCYVVVVFMSPGELHPGDLRVEQRRLRAENSSAYSAFSTLVKMMERTNAAFGVLTDEVISFVVNGETLPPCPEREFKGYPFSLSTSIPLNCFEIRLLLTWCIYDEAREWGYVMVDSPQEWLPLLGALNKPRDSDEADDEDLRGRTRFSDFDLYTMQRVWPLYEQFVVWHQRLQEDAAERAILPESRISFSVDSFVRRHTLQRSPYPLHQLPQDTFNSVLVNRTRRPRNAILDRILASSTTAALNITEVKRVGIRHFSQVFFCRVSGCSEVVCLKLFDERFFPIPELNDHEIWDTEPYAYLNGLNFSEDMMRREESIYDRLSYLQGTLLPHCYGFHLFTLPDGAQYWGIILEKICTPSLGAITTSSASLSFDWKASLITQVRHGVRALRAAGISQGDWHVNQILCTGDDGNSPEVVFIDFAFTFLYLGDEGGLPVRRDLMEVRRLLMDSLQVDSDTLSKLWSPPLEFEY